MLVDKKYVRRFSKTFIFCHWLNALSFCMLYLTGLPLYTEWFNFLYVVFGSQEVLQILHRVFAVMFISVPISFVPFKLHFTFLFNLAIFSSYLIF